MHFQGIAIDGPFQLYNALRRIQGGFRPGIDFQFFHGMGVPYAHYWLYRLLGNGFAAAELSRQMLATTVYTLVFLAFFRGFSRDWTNTLCLTTAALALSWMFKLTVVMFGAVGMLGLRSALPTLLPVALYVPRTGRTRIFAAGVLLGLSLLMGTEQGIAATLAYLLVAGVLILRRVAWRARLLEAAGTSVVAIVTMVVLLVMVGGIAGMRGVIRFNFSTVPKDQYWYFGAPPNDFLSSWPVVVETLVHAWPAGITIVAGIVLSILYLRRAWRSESEIETEATRRNVALATLPIYGVLSCGSVLGAFTLTYVQPLWRVLLLIALVELARFAAHRDERAQQSSWLGAARVLSATALALSAWTILRVGLVAATLYVAVVHVPRDHIGRHVGFTAGGIWPQSLREGQAIIDAHRGPHGELPVLWSVYSGWIEARNGIFNPSYDYMIHALGHDDREAYVEKFRRVRPALVQTMSPMYSKYEPWLENNNWQFYDELLTWYAVTGNTRWSLYWERRPQPEPQPTLLTTIEVPAGATTIALPVIPATAPSPISFFEVEVEYKVHNPLHALPLIGASPRYLIGIDGAYNDTPVSLPPYETRTRFLLFVAPGHKPSLHFQTFSLLPAAGFTASVVRIYSRPTDPRNDAWMMLMGQRFVAKSPE
jgi:hypothetical protein